MARLKPKSFLIPVLFFCVAFSIQNLNAQVFVSPATGGNRSADAPGFYYALPRTVVKVDVILEKNERFKGPYSEFTGRILGVDDFVKQNETVYTIIDIIVSSISEPDPQAWYFVEFDERGSRDARSLIFELQENGLILGADDAVRGRSQMGLKVEKTFVNTPDEKRFQYFAERNLYQRIDTIKRNITIDTTVIRRNILQSAWVDRNPEQKARAAADMIHKIRESRFNLISGFQEVNFGSGLPYMDQQLQTLEEEYLSLFLGKEVRSIVEHTVYYYPDKESKGIQPLARFTEKEGIIEGNVKGEQIQIVIEPLNLTSRLADDHKNTGRSRLNNNMYYRVPDMADISILFRGKNMARERFGIGQLGVISVAPLSKTRLLFDPNTGMISTIKRE